MQKKATLVGKFDAQLKEIGLQAGMRFGNRELSSEFLGESLPYLLTVRYIQPHTTVLLQRVSCVKVCNSFCVQTLLENPSLPHEIRLLIRQKHATEDQLRVRVITIVYGVYTNCKCTMS